MDNILWIIGAFALFTIAAFLALLAVAWLVLKAYEFITGK